MSKERLEEMEELLNVYYENIDDPFAITDNAMAIVDKVGYFVNRVQELEAIIEQDERQAVLEGLYGQNNRYREALERIAYDDELLSNTDDIIAAKEALEE